ncbi:MAG: LysR family transcriptional regulator, partial [Acidimicrobiaceae bacterium]|nr:LysR family transcriptional regulator [Acidimicrobiaceae bacterium]
LEAEMGSTSAIKSTLILRGSAGVLSQLAIKSEITDSSLVRIEVQGLDLRRTLHAVWSRHKGISHSERELVRVASQSG